MWFFLFWIYIFILCIIFSTYILIKISFFNVLKNSFLYKKSNKYIFMSILLLWIIWLVLIYNTNKNKEYKVEENIINQDVIHY